MLTKTVMMGKAHRATKTHLKTKTYENNNTYIKAHAHHMCHTYSTAPHICMYMPYLLAQRINGGDRLPIGVQPRASSGCARNAELLSQTANLSLKGIARRAQRGDLGIQRLSMPDAVVRSEWSTQRRCMHTQGSSRAWQCKMHVNYRRANKGMLPHTSYTAQWPCIHTAAQYDGLAYTQYNGLAYTQLHSTMTA